MRTKPPVGSEVYIKGYATLPFRVSGHNLIKGAKKPVQLTHPLTGEQMWFHLRELEAQS